MFIWKFLFFLSWIGVLALAVLGVYIGIIPASLNLFLEIDGYDIVMKNAVFSRIIVICISSFYIILAFAKVLFVFSKDEKSVIINTENGKIGVSLSAVDSLIKGISKNFSFINNITVKTYSKGNEVSVKLEIGVNAVKNLNNELKKIQDVIIKETNIKTGIELKNVDIITKKLSYNNNYEAEKDIYEDNFEKNYKNLNQNSLYSSEVEGNE